MRRFLNCKRGLDWVHRTVSHRNLGSGPTVDTSSTQGQAGNCGQGSPVRAGALQRPRPLPAFHPGLGKGRARAEGRAAAEKKDVWEAGEWGGSEAGLTPSRSPAWLRLVPQSCRPALGLPSLPPSLAFPSLRSDPAAWTPTGRLGSGRGRLGASDEGTGQVWGWRELPPGRGARRARPRGAPFAAALVASRGEPRKGGGRRGGQCQAGLLRAGASHPPSLGVPRVTAAAARQLLLLALLPTPAPGRCALAFPTEHLDGRACFHGESRVWTRPEARWSHDRIPRPRLAAVGTRTFASG
ncbi:uncharacterized protein [Castor canadensis]|uniref:Uncharacterized protein n=1 Tax=Castor canadensis TaxID=51338 RepID=A0AC58MG98_CASCN